MLGVAGGLFASIVASYRWPEYGLVSLGSGIAAGFVAAIAVSYRHSRKSVEPTDGNLVGEKPDCAGIDSAM
jgi:hypothetical protein